MSRMNKDAYTRLDEERYASRLSINLIDGVVSLLRYIQGSSMNSCKIK